MRPLSALHAALALAVLLALALPSAAGAARKVPVGFMGVNYDSAIAEAPADMQAAQFPRMAAAGVESVRATFNWALAQPYEDAPIRFHRTDAMVASAAARRVRVLPTFLYAPRWANKSSATFAPATDPRLMRRYVRALVGRYGPRGTFWDERPDLPRMAIRDWQFWNEPHFWHFWRIRDKRKWARSYTSHLKVFHKAVKDQDPRARVVLAALTNRSWLRLRDLYRVGAKRYFDVAAVHPFTREPEGVVTIVRYFRNEMRRHGDGRVPLLATEIGRPAAKGQVSKPSDPYLQTTARGMSKFLAATYSKLAAARRKLRLTRVYWYSWATEYRTHENDIFRYAGLFEFRLGQHSTKEKPAYRAYVRTARRLEGCVKGRSGRCR